MERLARHRGSRSRSRSRSRNHSRSGSAQVAAQLGIVAIRRGGRDFGQTRARPRMRIGDSVADLRTRAFASRAAAVRGLASPAWRALQPCAEAGTIQSGPFKAKYCNCCIPHSYSTGSARQSQTGFSAPPPTVRAPRVGDPVTPAMRCMHSPSRVVQQSGSASSVRRAISAPLQRFRSNPRFRAAARAIVIEPAGSARPVATIFIAARPSVLRRPVRVNVHDTNNAIRETRTTRYRTRIS